MKIKFLALFLIVAVVASVDAIYSYIQHQKNRSESITKVSGIATEIEPIVGELVALYQKRYDLLIQWQKIAGGKLPAEVQTAPKLEMKSSADFKAFDEFQMRVTNYLGTLLSNPEIRKRIKDLEKIEAEINRKREKYHSSALEADDLIEKYNTGQAMIPVFPVEEMIHKQKK
jgi:hypothetical protein